MRLRHIKGAEEEIAESPYVVQDPQSLKGRWHEFFGNDTWESSVTPAFCFADFRSARSWSFLIFIL